MERTTGLPGLTSGGFALAHDAMTAPPVHIPDGKGGAYKTELVLERSQQRTRKMIWWHAADPRTDPHNHPWPFVSTIIAGGYTELRWWFGPDGTIQHARCVYRAGDLNYVDPLVYHQVVGILPGTVTELNCGPAAEGNMWSYLDVVTGKITPWNEAGGNETFVDDLHAINPHLRQPEDELDEHMELLDAGIEAGVIDAFDEGLDG